MMNHGGLAAPARAMRFEGSLPCPAPPKPHQVRPSPCLWGLRPAAPALPLTSQATGPQQVASSSRAAPRHPEQHRGPRATPGPRWDSAPRLDSAPQPSSSPSSTPTFLSSDFLLWASHSLVTLSLALSLCLPTSVCLSGSLGVSVFLPSAALDLLSSATLGSPRAPLLRVSWDLWRRICSSSGGRATACLPGLSAHLGSSGRRVPVALAGWAGEWAGWG